MTSSRTERQVRRSIDRAVGRALVDGRYASALLADPVRTLGLLEITPPHLNEIQACDVEQFALQVHQQLWPQEEPCGRRR